VHYRIPKVDVILLEGIYLFKKQFVHLYDLRIWIECAFPTALARAITRSQEALSREQTIHVYNTIYFPAQLIHFETDNPKGHADIVINNTDKH
jgi:uridine kinase